MTRFYKHIGTEVVREIDNATISSLSQLVLPFMSEDDLVKSVHVSHVLEVQEKAINAATKGVLLIELDGILTCRLLRLGEACDCSLRLKRDAMDFLTVASALYTVYLLVDKRTYTSPSIQKLFWVLNKYGAQGMLSYENGAVNDFRKVVGALGKQKVSSFVLIKALNIDIRPENYSERSIANELGQQSFLLADLLPKGSRVTYYFSRHAYFDIPAESYELDNDDFFRLINLPSNKTLQLLGGSLAQRSSPQVVKVSQKSVAAIMAARAQEQFLKQRAFIVDYFLRELRIIDRITGDRHFPLPDSQETMRL